VRGVRSPSAIIERHVEVQRLGTCVYVELTGTVHGIAVCVCVAVPLSNRLRLRRKVTWCDIVKYRREVVTTWDSTLNKSRWNHRHRHRLSTAATCQLPALAARSFCRRLVSLWKVCEHIWYCSSGVFTRVYCEFPCKRFRLFRMFLLHWLKDDLIVTYC